MDIFESIVHFDLLRAGRHSNFSQRPCHFVDYLSHTRLHIKPVQLVYRMFDIFRFWLLFEIISQQDIFLRSFVLVRNQREITYRNLLISSICLNLLFMTDSVNFLSSCRLFDSRCVVNYDFCRRVGCFERGLPFVWSFGSHARCFCLFLRRRLLFCDILICRVLLLETVSWPIHF